MSPRVARRVAAGAGMLAAIGLSGAPGPAATASSAASVHMLVKGDWGFGGAAQAAVSRRMCAVHRRAPVDLLLTVGDNFYPAGLATQANYWRPERCLLQAGIPWRAAWGNHDLGDDSTATVLGATRRYYTFARGPMRVVVLDANRPADPAQVVFLRRTLAAAREPVRIAVMHQPAFTAGLHAPGTVQQRLWVPLFRRYGVALVLQGHNHAYERIERGGVTYITTGGGGAPVYPCIRPTQGLRVCQPLHHFLDLVVEESGVILTARAPTGATIDRVVVPAR